MKNHEEKMDEAVEMFVAMGIIGLAFFCFLALLGESGVL